MMEVVDGRYDQQHRQWSPAAAAHYGSGAPMQTSHQQQQQSAPSQARTIHQSQRHPMSPREHMQQARSLPQHSSHAMQANHSPLLNTQQMATPAIPYHAPANQVQSTTNQRMPSTHTPSHALSPPPLHNNTQAASIASQIDTAALQFALQKQMFLNQSLLAQQNQLRMEMGMQPTTDDGSTTSPAPHYTQPSPISFNRTPEPSFPPNHMMQQHQHHQQQLYPPSSHGMNVRHGSVSPPNSGGFGIGTLPMTRAPSLDAAMSSSPPPIKPEPHVKLETSVRRPQKSKRAAMHDDDSVSESEEDLDAGSHSDSSSPAASDNDDGTSSQASATESDSGPDEDDDMDIPPPKRQSTGGSKDEPRATPVQKRKPKQQSAGGSRAKQSTSAKKDSKEKEKSPSSSPVLNAHGKPKRLRGMSCHQCKTRRTSLDLCHCGQAHVKKSTSARARKRKKERMCRKKYCARCLDKFYNEDAPPTLQPGEVNTWSCPGCRGLCTCAACKRGDQKRQVQEAAEAAQEAQQQKRDMKQARERKDDASSSSERDSKEKTQKEKPGKSSEPSLSSSSSQKKRAKPQTTSSSPAKPRSRTSTKKSSDSSASSSAQSSAKSTPTITSKSSRGTAKITTPLSLSRSSKRGTVDLSKHSPAASAISFGSAFGHLGADGDLRSEESTRSGGEMSDGEEVEGEEEDGSKFTGTSVSDETDQRHPLDVEFTEVPPSSHEFASLASPKATLGAAFSPSMQKGSLHQNQLSPAMEYGTIFHASTISPPQSYSSLVTSQPNSPWGTTRKMRSGDPMMHDQSVPMTGLDLPEMF